VHALRSVLTAVMAHVDSHVPWDERDDQALLYAYYVLCQGPGADTPDWCDGRPALALDHFQVDGPTSISSALCPCGDFDAWGWICQVLFALGERDPSDCQSGVRDLEVVGGRLHNRVTDTFPLVLHAPGGLGNQGLLYALAAEGLRTPVETCLPFCMTAQRA
jgi:hypothetical protein